MKFYIKKPKIKNPKKVDLRNSIIMEITEVEWESRRGLVPGKR